MKLIKVWQCSYQNSQGGKHTSQYVLTEEEAIEWKRKNLDRDSCINSWDQMSYFSSEKYVLQCPDSGKIIPVESIWDLK